VNGKRYLVITADDFGIGPATSRGILDLAVQGRISAAVLLANSPYAEQAVRDWQQTGEPMELGWHPCLTLDRPVLPVKRVPSLVDAEGRFWPLSGFMLRLKAGRIRPTEIDAELRAQLHRFWDLAGFLPPVVNSHHHIQVLRPVGAILSNLFDRLWTLPYVRRVREPWWMLARVPGARAKRAFLSLLGRRDACRLQRQKFPGNDWLAGITDPPLVADPDFLTRWITRVPGQCVELTCHPGHMDPTLIGRDCTATDGQLLRRVREWHLLQDARFVEAFRKAGFTLVSPSLLSKLQTGSPAYAA
jgi:predicted glycoside hydrolase/deacetylase ChbG (UPF0249 family)